LRKINSELWVLLFLVVIAAMLNFLVASQRMALVFYFLPTLFSAYHFGRRHATLTAVASVVLVVLLAYINPYMFTRRVDLPFDARWFDLTVWGGVLMVAGYAMGTLYEHNQKTLREMEADRAAKDKIVAAQQARVPAQLQEVLKELHETEPVYDLIDEVQTDVELRQRLKDALGRGPNTLRLKIGGNTITVTGKKLDHVPEEFLKQVTLA